MTLSRPRAEIAVTARICVLYGDFSARSDGGLQSFHFLVSLLAGPNLVLRRNGVQLRLLAHPCTILSSGEFRNFLAT